MSIFDKVPGAPIGGGTAGVIRCGTALVAVLTDWRAVHSPHYVILDGSDGEKDMERSHLPVLYAAGSVRRYWVQNKPLRLTAYLTPAPTPYRLGQKRPPVPKPFTLTGNVLVVSPTQVILNEGSIVYGIPDQRPTSRSAH